MVSRVRRARAGVSMLVLAVASAATLAAQQPPAGAGRGEAPPTPRAAAPFDMTGYWVSVVTEDWQWRMLTPPKGDFVGVPLNAEGRRVGGTWDLAQDKASGNECRAFGVAGVMRRPGRLNISWQDDTTLKIETSAGNQTRMLRFGPPAASTGEPTWQGVSVAEWRKQPQVRGPFTGPPRGGGSVAGGNLKVVTTKMRSGYLRPNGLPYSEDAIVTEYFNRYGGPGNLEWLTVTTIVEDSKYLDLPFITSTEFKKEPDGSKFSATPCRIDPPRVVQVVP